MLKVGATVQVGDRQCKVARKLSEGGFSYVFLVKDRGGGGAHPKGAEYALKQIMVPCGDATAAALAAAELELLRLLPPHPHVVEMIGGSLCAEHVLLLLGYAAGGTLADRVTRVAADQLGLLELLGVARQVGSALAHLHGQNPAIVHRDIKLENVLVGPGGPGSGLRLTDFGSCARQSGGPEVCADRRSLLIEQEGAERVIP